MKKQILGLDWKEHLLYILLLLTVGWFFQQKTTELDRLHDTMEAVFPLAAQTIIPRHNSMLMERIQREADHLYGPVERGLYRARAKAIQTLVERTKDDFKRIAESPDKEYQRKELASLLEQLSHLPDSILLACDSDSTVGQKMRKTFPDAFWGIATAYLPQAEQSELARLANVLHLRAGLAANDGLRYCFSKVREYAIQYAYLPVLETRQSCPRVGEMFEAEIYLAGYIAEPDFEVEINGQPVVADNGLVHFEQRFTRPGKHKIKARFVRPMNEEGEKRLYEREFEVEVGPR